MATRVYGPVRAAGTRVEELEADKTIQGAVLGVTGHLGVYEKGPVGLLTSTFSKKDAARKLGGRIDDFLTPDAMQDFWDHSEGNGEYHAVRITDGTEVKASRSLFTRRLTAGKLRIPLATIEAHNAGRWGGKRKALGDHVVGIGSFTATTLATTKTMKLNEWKDAELTLDGVSGRTYRVVSNTIAGVVTVESDENMIADLGLAPVEFGWTLKQRNNGKACAIEVGIDDLDPANRFYIKTIVDGMPVKTYEHLSINPTDANYYAKVISDDILDNYEIKVTNIWTGGVHSDIKPGWTGKVTSLAVGGKVLTVEPYFVQVTSPVAGALPTFTLGATTETMEWEDTITIVVDPAPATGTVTSARWGALGTITFGVAFTPNTPYLPPFTVTNGVPVLAAGDTIQIEWVPFVPNGLVNGTLLPKLAASSFRYNIVSNTIRTITVNQDMTGSGVAPADQWMLIAPMELSGGYDGSAGVTDADFIAKLDTATSPFNDLRGQNKGLVKLASPGKTSSDVQKAGIVYARFNAYEWRIDIPSTTTSESAAIDWVNNTIGRDDFAVVTFPSFVKVSDPDRPSILKLISATGMIQGREAKVASQYTGYHRAEAGTIVDLPRVKAFPTNVAERFDEERMNPAGLGIIKKIGASYYLWGDRTISPASDWQWKHQREQMDHYINTLRESFPWALFDINDPISDMPVLANLNDYFLKEWNNRALDRSFPFKDACQIKMDGTVNTTATRGAGDKIAEIRLRLANVTERLILRIGKAGIFEAVGG